LKQTIKIFSILFLLLVSSKLFAQEVILIRHAKVFLEEEGWMGAKKAAKYRALYDTAPIYQFLPDTVLTKLPARKTDTVYVSGLARSIATGWKLFGDSVNLVSMDLLNEFELHVVRLPLILPFKGWTAVSRSLWVLGLNQRNTESFKEGKKRANTVVDFIEEKTLYREQVIIVAHGFLNRTVTKEMKKRGWRIMENRGQKNLGATIFRK